MKGVKMQKSLVILLFVGLIFDINAKSELRYFDLQKALHSEQVKSTLPNNIEFRFWLDSGKDTHIISQNLQITKQRKRAFTPSIQYACQDALGKTLLAFANRAKLLNATKVVNIVGFTNIKGIKGNFNSIAAFECLVKYSKVKVTLQADFAK